MISHGQPNTELPENKSHSLFSGDLHLGAIDLNIKTLMKSKMTDAHTKDPVNALDLTL